MSSESGNNTKRFKRDYSLDGWPIADMNNQAILNMDDLVVILNGFHQNIKELEKMLYGHRNAIFLFLNQIENVDSTSQIDLSEFDKLGLMP